MGICQPSPEWQAQRIRNSPEYQRNRKAEAERSAYAELVYQYLRLYGKPVNQQTRDFIDKNYNKDYKGVSTWLNGQKIWTYKYEVETRLRNAHQKGYKTWTQRMLVVDERNRTLQYSWAVKTPNIVNYECKMTFDEENRFLAGEFKQVDYSTKYVKLQDQTEPSPYNTIRKPQNTMTYDQSPAYYGPGPQKVDYNAMLQKSNQDFRNKMNKQAEEWNNYARQKNNRGW